PIPPLPRPLFPYPTLFRSGYGTQFDFQRHWQGMLKADQSGLGIMTKVAAEIKKAVSIPVGAVTYMDPARDPEFFERLIADGEIEDRKSTRLNSSHVSISYA